MQQDKTVFWLKGASLLVVGFGLAISFAAHPATSGITEIFADLIIWPIDGMQSLASPETRILCAILGGVMTGWGVLFWQLSTKLFPRDPELARTLIYWSIGVWFVIDGIGSIVAGAPLNVFFNIGFLIAFILPLWRTKKFSNA